MSAAVPLSIHQPVAVDDVHADVRNFVSGWSKGLPTAQLVRPCYHSHFWTHRMSICFPKDAGIGYTGTTYGRYQRDFESLSSPGRGLRVVVGLPLAAGTTVLPDS